jgi:hypothetical protein
MQPLISGELSAIRPRLPKIGEPIEETRIKLAFAYNCPDAARFRRLINALIPRLNANGEVSAPVGPCLIDHQRLADAV